MNHSIALIRRALAESRLTYTPLADGTGVLLCISSHKVLTLNESAAALVEALRAEGAGQAELDSALRALSEEAQHLPTEQLHQDIQEVLDSIAGVLPADN